MSEENKAVVRRFAEACWGDGAFDVADEIVAHDVVRNGQPIGRRGLTSVIGAVRSAVPDFHTEIEDLVAEGNRVAWRYSSAGSHTGAPLFGTPATGRAVNWTGTAILRIEGGMIQEIWDNVDLLAIYSQLGCSHLRVLRRLTPDAPGSGVPVSATRIDGRALTPAGTPRTTRLADVDEPLGDVRDASGAYAR
jgi:predicted ester cyclase